jgi:esterase/lipase superfamily enzyme
MRRQYHTWFSSSLGREMELLIFGHAGIPALVFPTSCGRFFEFEDRGMVDAIHGKIDAGQVQLICVDSVDSESWYNQGAAPRERIARHMQYERYLMDEVLPLIRQTRQVHPVRHGHHEKESLHLATLGCSFGGYHAVTLALRHPDVFTSFLSMSGTFDLTRFLSGYYDQDCYFNLPLHFLPNLSDPWYLDRYRHNNYVLATAVHDSCREENERLARLLREKGIACRLDVWGADAGHDWPWWQRMLQSYL